MNNNKLQFDKCKGDAFQNTKVAYCKPYTCSEEGENLTQLIDF